MVSKWREPGLSLLEWEFAGKQGEEAGTIYVVTESVVSV